MSKIYTLLSIGGGFEQKTSIEKALLRGYKVVCVDGDKDSFLLRDLLPSFFQEKKENGFLIPIHCNIQDTNKLKEITTSYNIDCTLPQPLGKIITSMGFINSHFNFKGISLEATLNFTNKDRVNKIQTKYDLPRATQFTLNNIDDVTFPCMIKPVHGSGSRGVIYVENKDKLNHSIEYAFSKSKGDEIVIESFIEGTEYSVNFIIKDNDYREILLIEKRLSNLPYRQEVEYFTNDLTPSDKKIILETTFKLSKALGINNSLINADVILSKDKKAYVLDIAGRPGGNSLNTYFSYHNISPIDIWFDVILEDHDLYSPSLKENDYQCMRFLDLVSGEIIGIDTNRDTNILLNTSTLKVGDVIEPIECGADVFKRGFVLAKGNSIKEARSICEREILKYKIKTR